MKIAYFGYNALSSCLDFFIRRGDEVVCVFTGEKGVYTDRIINQANQCQIALDFSKPDKKTMERLIEQEVELFFVAEYPWKIPIPAGLDYAVNLHPTMLPEGRGPTPLSTLLLQDSKHAGISLHKLTEQFDAGDILLQKKIAVSDNESYDTLSAKIFIEAPKLLANLMLNISGIYANSVSQEGGSYWEKLTEEDQTIDWNDSASNVLTKFRAFGSLGVYADVNGQKCLLTAADGLVYAHDFEAGEVIYIDQIRVVVACADGMITIVRSALTTL